MVTANTVNNEPRGELDTGVFVYNTSTQAATLLTSFAGQPIGVRYVGEHPGRGRWSRAVHQQRRAGGWLHRHPGQLMRASIWDGTTITDLNTTYAGILPSNVTLNCASAIDNNGDIAGICTVGSSTYQPFVIFSTVPEPSSVVLLVAGLVGLLVCALAETKVTGVLLQGDMTVFHRCLLLLLAASLSVSQGAVGAESTFVDVEPLNSSATADLQSFPTVANGGAAVLGRAQASNSNYYDVCYYSGGSSGTMTNVMSQFTHCHLRCRHTVQDGRQFHE